MTLLLFACRPPVPDDPGRVVISTLQGDSWLVADAETGDEEGRFELAVHHPELCQGDERLCLGYQARHNRGSDGADAVIYTFSPIDMSDGSEFNRTDRIGHIAAASWPAQETLWQISALDFSQLAGGEAWCSYEPSDPCHPPESLGDRDFQFCHLYQPHDLWVVSQDDASLVLWVADARNARLLKLSIELNSDCAVVQDALGLGSDGWGDANSPNSFARREQDGVEQLIVSTKDSFDGDGAGDGAGHVSAWSRTSDGWRLDWRIPEYGSFNAPHGLALGEDGTMAFAHSGGRAAALDAGAGGSVSVWRLVDEEPEYLYDAVPGGADGAFSYPRDVMLYGDGQVLLADSGCKGGFDCTRPMGLSRFELPEQDAAGLSGAWSAEHTEQRFIAVDRSKMLFTDESLIYSVEAVPSISSKTR